MNTQKTTLRNELRLVIRNLPQAYFSLAGKKIGNHLFDSEIYKKAKNIMCFVSVKGEPDTMPILKGILNDGKRLFLPVIRDSEIFAAEAEDFDFAIGKYNIPEPKGKIISKDEIDLVLLPCLSANMTGARLGKGGGYYDRFLEDYRGVTAVVCAKKLLRNDIPMEDHDKRCEYILTEDGLYNKNGCV